ncbi:MAG TPA: bifunctional DNA-formamidopyrimidine glycosylase/DNA-(apurinic or apyrimidinic site) lyase, partial [Candidatus Saccharimonadia bacterium]|nr:bifunctional DNA-formamidopyrimidine glycosylase/DNA-(apurinic or apyrimidinic site) lyase [Candidatus Saccharimonadia bacterium]
TIFTTMPELPEVETIVRGLDSILPKKTIKSISFDTSKSFPNDQKEVELFAINSKIVNVRRRAKVIIIDLSTSYSFIIHLKMTGQLVYKSTKKTFGGGHPNDSLIGNLPDKSTRVTVELKDGSWLFFNDQRKFGWVKLLPTIEIMNLNFFKKIGPEPLNIKFNSVEFYNRLQRRLKSSIKPVLLDQTIIAGIGNIYADESLWLAKIHPVTRVQKLSKRKIDVLLESIRKVLNLSLDKGGSTDKNYINAFGEKGSYLEFANVFRRAGQPCPRCGTPIIKMKVNGRGTHICPKEQKIVI